MALIRCTACGKPFSDQAESCPYCGCPTETVRKAANAGTGLTANSKTQESQTAAKTILAEVEKVRKEANSADRLFDSRASSIQSKARQGIDLFSGYATNRAVEIQADARRACDDLYTTYQALIEHLDSVCRPLLSKQPGIEAIKAVADLIKYLNEESEIENNLGVTFNGSNLGNISSSKYIPRLSNKSIQKFWETQFSTSPDVAEYEKKRRKEAEEAQKRREEERRREAERKRQEEQRQTQLGNEYKAKMEKVETDCREKVSAFSTNLNKRKDEYLQTVRGQLAAYIDELRREKQKAEQSLAELGSFRGREKREKKSSIEILARKIQLLSDPGILRSEEAAAKEAVDAAVKEYKESVDAYLGNRFPDSKKNTKPYLRYKENTYWAGRKCPDAPSAESVIEKLKH